VEFSKKLGYKRNIKTCIDVVCKSRSRNMTLARISVKLGKFIIGFTVNVGTQPLLAATRDF
jgi:hypothetical protein